MAEFFGRSSTDAQEHFRRRLGFRNAAAETISRSRWLRNPCGHRAPTAIRPILVDDVIAAAEAWVRIAGNLHPDEDRCGPDNGNIDEHLPGTSNMLARRRLGLPDMALSTAGRGIDGQQRKRLAVLLNKIEFGLLRALLPGLA